MPAAFYQPFFKHFAILQNTYNFQVVHEAYDESGFGSGQLRLASQRYFLEFQVDGLGPEVTICAGKSGSVGADLGWIFAYLTREQRTRSGSGSSQSTSTMQSGGPLANSSPKAGGASPVVSRVHTSWLYYYPHFSLNLWGESSVAWQAARLANVLQPMWPAIFIFLDMDGPRGSDFAAFQQRVKQAVEEQAADVYRVPAERVAERAALGFTAQVQKSFAFLQAYGLRVVHADPVFVRYETVASPGQLASGSSVPSMYVNVFHRLLSYTVGVHTGSVQSNPAFEQNFDLEELAAWSRVAYQPATANRAEELPGALNRAARLYRRCAAPLLGGDPRLFDGLLARRIDAAHRASRAWANRDRGL